MADRPLTIVFRCPVCLVGFECYLHDPTVLTPDELAGITAACGNKHPKLVPMERVEAAEVRS